MFVAHATVMVSKKQKAAISSTNTAIEKKLMWLDEGSLERGSNHEESIWVNDKFRNRQ
ncbi:hypothetical protein [Bacillus sp. T33-2]|uniref:hypothetical protein n=1 Tax=Bacillus sp. T33-2 TaxID=2054168 RepID=UPI0015E0F099|nr:hypothetical protein [Bacillus sp. T33-2]